MSAIKNIQLIQNELAIVWDDGGESYVPLEKLRRACPCAACGGERDVLGHVYQGPPQNYQAESFQVKQLQLVGGYAVSFIWKDGHYTGIYSFPLLKKLGMAES